MWEVEENEVDMETDSMLSALSVLSMSVTLSGDVHASMDLYNVTRTSYCICVLFWCCDYVFLLSAKFH